MKKNLLKSLILTLSLTGIFSGDKKRFDIEVILKKIKDSQTIMFGENHSPRYFIRGEERIFFRTLISDFRRHNFNYFAVELPTEAQPYIDKLILGEINSNQYLTAIEIITMNNGGYLIGDGCYGLIKKVSNSGLKVVAYDDWSISPGSNRDKKTI